jgi:RND family efflux transporter MFP subunit
MLKRKKLFIFLLLVIIAGGFFGYRYKNNNAVPVTEEVKRGDVVETVSLTGFVEPRQYADLSFISTGRIEKLMVAVGDEVTKGGILMTLDNPVTQAQYQEAVLGLRIAESTEMLAKRHWDDLKPEERVSQKLATQAAAAKAGTAASQFVSSRVIAPFAGRVTRLDARPGETVAPGSVVARIQEGNEFIIRAKVSETEVAKLQEGLPATISFDALEDQTFTGTLESLSTSALQNQDVVTYEALFTFSVTDARLRDGMTADIEVITAEKKNTLTLPSRALKKRGDAYTVEKYTGENQAAETVIVETGLEGDEGTVEIKSGLGQGDRVVVGENKTK